MSKKGKAIGSYFNMDIIERINFEHLRKKIAGKKNKYTLYEKFEKDMINKENKPKVRLQRANTISKRILKRIRAIDRKIIKDIERIESDLI